MQTVVTALESAVVYELAQRGISNILAIHTYTAGIDPSEHVRILSGTEIKEILAFKPNDECNNPVFFVAHQLLIIPAARVRTFIACYQDMNKQNPTSRIDIPSFILSLPSLLMPPLRVRLLSRVEGDRVSPHVFLRNVPSNKVGLAGFFQTNVLKEAPKRILNNRIQVTLGIIQLGCALLLAYALFDRFKNSPYISTFALTLA
jgi:hypothetical protein